MPAFDCYLTVDWSAANSPKKGKDSIWFTELARKDGRLVQTCLENPSTRDAATRQLADLLGERVAQGKRVLAGFDFPFGYPTGTVTSLGHTGLLWRKIWSELDDGLVDGPDNHNNRFDLAERLNERISGEAFPFWGSTERRHRPFLKYKGRRPHGPGDLAERRLVEHRIRTTQPCWKLAYNGAVGSQALTGIPRVWQLRTDPRIAFATAIWPFETGLSDQAEAQVILAEAYPSLVKPEEIPGKPKDAGQVVALARHYADLDEVDRLGTLFEADPALTEEEKQKVEAEEAWILGVTGEKRP
ncbi:cobalamin biosynthesis protein CbiG [Aestuariispira insulae]|uniref:Cobalamin biosynthesis protein CbiG n=1 Tax=Aestuariispira insulae TaxID=1461337 RepID=A0A3D9HDX3_9PROT|nr:cobalamin biosynthesis protein CbiG [Aestuariispira insulae]RED47675.1 hypothetical protein DFP90_10939 [Aestuariispira insulae]